MRLLIIDDDTEDVEYFLEVVNNIIPDCDCDSAASCEEGLIKLEEAEDLPSHIFLDGMLYGMSSQECVQRIKGDERLQNIRVVMYSGYAPPAVQRDFMSLGANRFLIKPSTTAELEKSLRELLSLR